jgi:hypothetical protein
MLLKKLPGMLPVRYGFEATAWNFQLTDFAGLTLKFSLVESEMHTTEQRPQQMPIEQSMEDATMGSTFDIFKETPDGPLWVEAVQGLREARERMARLALTCPGEYFIHSQSKRIVATPAGEWAEVT